jgi:hypothetical protein
MVVLTTSDPKLFEGLTKDSPQIKALDDWLKIGGKMLLCAGKDSEQFLENEDGFLHLFLPGTYAGMAELRSGTQFELFVNSKRQIVMNGTEEAPFMKMPRFTEPRGITFVKDGDLPLVLRAAHGLGTVIYFGGDLSGKPLGNWRDRTTLVRSVMQWNRTQERGTGSLQSGVMLQLGYNDISGQIRSALDQFEGVRIVPFSVILLILTAYWLVIGLFDWFFVHKVLKRPILTWVTFPLWIVLFSVLTYTLAAPGRPDKTKFNILSISDVDIVTGTECFTDWESFYSPIDKRHVNVAPISLGFGYRSWNGLPGSGLGGMAPKTMSPAVWQVGSDQVSYGEIRSVPFQARSTKSFFSRQYIGDSQERRESNGMKQPDNPDEPFFHAAMLRSQQSCNLSDEEGIPVGTFEVPDFVHPDYKGKIYLTNCILAYGRWIIELGDIQPGEPIRVTKTTPRRDLRDLLIPQQSLEDDTLRRMATYNPQSADLEYIVRVMSLHRALGGYEATGLHHAYMPSLDMSDLLTADRVLLLGTVFRPFQGGANEQSTSCCGTSDSFRGSEFHRYSFPITLTESSPRIRVRRDNAGPSILDEKTRPIDYATDPVGGQ